MRISARQIVICQFIAKITKLLNQFFTMTYEPIEVLMTFVYFFDIHELTHFILISKQHH